MTTIQETLVGLPEETKKRIEPVFGSVEILYEVVYLIAKNEHLTDLNKPDNYESRMAVIRRIRLQVEKLLTSYGLDGKEIVADIASDYFEDYVKYVEKDVSITNEQFMQVLHKIEKSEASQ
ncbi:MAG TPA: hypothetical protein DDZ04_03605 [Parabacteroides sp.]|nr:hypothetical protein [Parabacteroides sp.]